MIDKYVSRNPQKAKAFTSLGSLRYLSLMHFVDAVIGNSSSGIIEAPGLGIGTINVGDRQRGRIKSGSIIDCSAAKESIKKAISKIYTPGFQKSLKDAVNSYGNGDAAFKILKVLKKHGFGSDVKKRFYDVSFKVNGR